MFKIVRQVIDSGRFELSGMLRKIDTIWMQGDLTDEEKDNLVALAREKANPENSYADLQRQVNDLYYKMSAQNEAIKALEAEIKALKGETPEDSEDTEEPTINEYPEYVAPTGAHDAYHAGDKVTFNGQKYTCIAPEGAPVVWDPNVYPAYWELVDETETN